MRAKRYFWNMQHHRELDRKMGLSRQMAEPFRSLADACGMDTELGGTHGLKPFFLFTNKQQDVFKTEQYDVTDEKQARRFFPIESLN